jgi:endonuclease/exonuclease/phosphatase family metal-dependent hydrolase
MILRCYNGLEIRPQGQVPEPSKVKQMTSRPSVETITLGEVGRSLASLLSPLLASLFFLEALRLYLSQVYLVIWAALFSEPIDPLGLAVGGFMLSVFLVPLLMPLLRRWLRVRTIALASAVGLALIRLLLSAGLPFYVEAVASWVSISLFTLFVPAYFAQYHPAHTPRRRRGYLVAGFALALAYDMAIRALGTTLDLSLQPAWLSIQVLLSALAIAAAYRAATTVPPGADGQELPPLPRSAGTLMLSGFGALLFLELNLFMHASTVSRWIQVDYDLMAMLLPSATVIGLLIPRFKGLQSLPAALVQNLVIVCSVVAFLWLDGWVTGLLVLAAQVCVMLDLRLLFQAIASHCFRWKTSTIVGLALSVSLLITFLLTFMLTLTFAYAYTLAAFRGLEPVPFLAAAVFLGVTACVGAHKTRMEDMPPPEVPWLKQSVAGLPVILALAGSVFQPIVNPQPTEHRSLTVMSYNLHQSFGMDNKLDLEEILATINKANPDLVGFQEADAGRVPSLSVDQVLWLSRRLNLYSVYGPSWGNTYGVAVLSRYPVASYQRYLLPSQKQQRACLQVEIDLGSRSLTFFTVHLGLDPQERHRQLDQLLLYTAQAPSPKILVGDFNASPASGEIERVLEQFDHSYAISGTGNGYTSPADAPRQTIDYIFVSSDIQVLSAEVIPSLASDHLPIAAEISLGSP